MTGLWVALSLIKPVADIRAVLEAWFPELAVAAWDLSSVERAREALENPVVRAADVLIQVEHGTGDFPTGIHIDRFPGPHEEAVVQPTMVELARRFACAFDCRTMCDGSGYGDDDAPCWTIVWDRGTSFLVDDSAPERGVQARGGVRLVREISLPAFELDASGQATGDR
jgi:hypothetical protein